MLQYYSVVTQCFVLLLRSEVVLCMNRFMSALYMCTLFLFVNIKSSVQSVDYGQARIYEHQGIIFKQTLIKFLIDLTTLLIIVIF